MNGAAALAPQMASPDELPEAYAHFVAVTHTVTRRLEPRLHEMVRLRASQINGCADAIDMHARQARTAGESEQRLHLLPCWRHAPLFTTAERAALELCEAMALGPGDVPEHVYRRAADQFEPDQLTALIFAIATTNAWSELTRAIEMRSADR